MALSCTRRKWAHCTCTRSDNHTFIPVPNSSQDTDWYDMEVCVTLKQNAFPDHHWSITESVRHFKLSRAQWAPAQAHVLEELDYICNLTGLQVPFHASSSDKDAGGTQNWAIYCTTIPCGLSCIALHPLSISFGSNQEKLICNHLCFTKWTDWYPWRWTDLVLYYDDCFLIFWAFNDCTPNSVFSAFLYFNQTMAYFVSFYLFTYFSSFFHLEFSVFFNRRWMNTCMNWTIVFFVPVLSCYQDIMLCCLS